MTVKEDIISKKREMETIFYMYSNDRELLVNI